VTTPFGGLISTNEFNIPMLPTLNSSNMSSRHDESNALVIRLCHSFNSNEGSYSAAESDIADFKGLLEGISITDGILAAGVIVIASNGANTEHCIRIDGAIINTREIILEGLNISGFVASDERSFLH
jgi:hypothetical protein